MTEASRLFSFNLPSAVVLAVAPGGLANVVDMVAFLFPCRRRSSRAPATFFDNRLLLRLRRRIEKIAVFLDMRGEAHRMLADQALGLVRIVGGEVGDDRAVVGDRPL